MNKKYIGLITGILLVSGCTVSERESQIMGFPTCQNETMETFEDGFQVPTCSDFVSEPEIYAFSYIPEDLTPISERDVNPDEIEGEFPEVEINKYIQNQVVLQNLKTRVLAYCRGSDDDIAVCVEKLECKGFRRITEVPYMSAKYDTLKRGTYPTRRWRNGEGVSRW